MGIAKQLILLTFILLLNACSTNQSQRLVRHPASQMSGDKLSCKKVSATFIENHQASNELANLSGIKYLTQKLSEIEHLDSSNITALLLRYNLVMRNDGKEVIKVPLSKLKSIHPVDRGASIAKTKARSDNIKDFIAKNGVPEAFTTDIQEITIKSRMLMRAVKTDEGNYIIFDGNGRLYALRDYFQSNDLSEMPIEIELYKIEYKKIKSLMEIRRRNLYATGEDVSQARKSLYQSHISNEELDEMISNLKSESKKYWKYRGFFGKRENRVAMKELSEALDVKVRQLENVKLWREKGYGIAYKEKITTKQIEAMANKEVPLGMTKYQFKEMKYDLAKALRVEELDDGHVIMDGTSTTFYSANPKRRLGTHFQKAGITRSDYNFKIHSPKLVKKMMEKDLKWYGHERFYKTRWVEKIYPEIQAFKKKWSKILGRKISIVGADIEVEDVDQHGRFIIDLTKD
ncbi:hypothetical protein A9Q84_07595 [Halobacteriovorax marinus]|uniref:Uncharacterized protein n=1 Tax=Halobacteriovorax marinus TaxID=97084 RepID=A0A1Y5F5Q1_9BACT|nr:hypothetical protein A9Q84_07595 [Halobacteriovorax marinus]